MGTQNDSGEEPNWDGSILTPYIHLNMCMPASANWHDNPHRKFSWHPIWYGRRRGRRGEECRWSRFGRSMASALNKKADWVLSAFSIRDLQESECTSTADCVVACNLKSVGKVFYLTCINYSTNTCTPFKAVMFLPNSVFYHLNHVMLVFINVSGI